MQDHSSVSFAPRTAAERPAGGSGSRLQAPSPSLKHVAPKPLLDPLTRVGRETISWKRKIFHVLGCGVVGVAYQATGTPWLMALVVMAAIAFIFVGLDSLRFWVPSLNKKIRRDFGPYMRNYELNRLSGSSWFLLATLLTIGLFPREAACLAFIHLALGDPIASFVGVRWGRIRLPGGKSLEGSLALFATCFLAGTAFLLLAGGVTTLAGTTLALTTGSLLAVAVGSALAAAVAEWIPTRGKLDDNFVVPILTAALTTGVIQLLA